MKFILITFLLISPSVSCAPQSNIALQGVGHFVQADDGTKLASMEIRDRNRPDSRPEAVLFYIQGSGQGSVQHILPRLAGAVVLNVRPIIVERRGVGFEGEIDSEKTIKGSALETRVADHHAVIRSHLKRFPSDLPVILVGGSEGGAIAGIIATREPRVTHLVLISSGGWTQAREFEFMLERDGSVLDIQSGESLKEKLTDIKSEPDATKMWAGHPYLRWSSFLWYDPLPDLRRIDIPIFVAHGTEDDSVPVESARAIRTTLADREDSKLTYVELSGLNHTLFDTQRKTSGFPLLEIELVRFFADHGLLNESEERIVVERVKRNHPKLFAAN